MGWRLEKKLNTNHNYFLDTAYNSKRGDSYKAIYDWLNKNYGNSEYSRRRNKLIEQIYSDDKGIAGLNENMPKGWWRNNAVRDVMKGYMKNYFENNGEGGVVWDEEEKKWKWDKNYKKEENESKENNTKSILDEILGLKNGGVLKRVAMNEAEREMIVLNRMYEKNSK